MRPASNQPTSLYTDHYELTMLQATLDSGAAHRPSVFEAFARRLPDGRRYGVLAGTGRVLAGLEKFRFNEDQLDFLADTNVVNAKTIDYLADFTFTGNIYGYAEGEVYFPYSPVLIVEGTFAECCVLETYILSVLNHDTAISSAASRMTQAAGQRACFEMGSRRTHEASAVAAARASVIGGFAATSNLEAGYRYGLKTVGTAAHSFTLVHDTEKDAFQAQINSLGVDTSLLVDTYDVEAGVRAAVEVAGEKLGAIRLDSGDLVEQAHWVRQLLDELGNTHTKIMVTSDLDEYAISSLRSAPVDSYGVGTRLVTGSGAPTASMVYKLVSRADANGQYQSVAKAASGKKSVGGRKFALRQRTDRGIAEAELLGIGTPVTDDGDDRNLLEHFVVDGELADGWTGHAAVDRAAQRHLDSVAELPPHAKKLQPGQPVIPTLFIDPQDRG